MQLLAYLPRYGAALCKLYGAQMDKITTSQVQHCPPRPVLVPLCAAIQCQRPMAIFAPVYYLHWPDTDSPCPFPPSINVAMFRSPSQSTRSRLDQTRPHPIHSSSSPPVDLDSTLSAIREQASILAVIKSGLLSVKSRSFRGQAHVLPAKSSLASLNLADRSNVPQPAQPSPAHASQCACACA